MGSDLMSHILKFDLFISGVGSRDRVAEEAADFAVGSGETASTQTVEKFGSGAHGRRRLERCFLQLKKLLYSLSFF
jgi:hypothetical protein